MGRRIFFIIAVLIFLAAGRGEAFWITEIYADPAVDANNDGVISSTGDEFVELYNGRDSLLDLSGWSLADATRTRHIFPQGSLLAAGETLIVFGGGSPSLSQGTWQTASTGTLSLNNSGDSVFLYDAGGALIEQVDYGSIAGFDESIVRSPETTGELWVKHSSLSGAAGRVQSAGYLVNPPDRVAAVPEPMTLCSVLTGLGLLFRLRCLNG